MQNGLQINLNVLRISKLMMSSTSHGFSGYDVSKRLAMNLATTRSILERLEEINWLCSYRQRNTNLSNFTPKRIFRLTALGYESAATALRALNGST